MQLMGFQDSLKKKKIYRYDQIKDVMSEVRKNFRFHCVNTKHKYFNVPAAFDIETTSFYDAEGKKTGIMYAWMFGIYGAVVMGRTWEEFVYMIRELCDVLKLGETKRLIVYVHNLQFDFAFFRHYFHFKKVFAIDSRKPLFALADCGIEFRCSYLLSGFSLAKLGDELTRYKVRKAAGDLDYSLIRHSCTKLTRKEINYCVKDVKVVMAYIAEEIENNGGIANIPYTKTGYVRRYCRESCFYEPGQPRKKSVKRLKYHEMIEQMSLTPDLYEELRRAFCGGFTHANAIYSGRTVENVGSYDFTSSYPAVMIAEKYPTGAPKKIDTDGMYKSDFKKYLTRYCCVFDIEFLNIRMKPDVFENYISESRCFKLSEDYQIEGQELKTKVKINNGRVVQAGSLWTTLTEIDLSIIEQLYDYNAYRISNLYVWKKDYLPRDFMLAILSLYVDKTTLKGVKGKEAEYMVKKGMLNSAYGMAVCRVVRMIYGYEDDWLKPKEADTAAEIEKYNKKWDRFLYYAWGVWVTAYARRNLFTGILEAGIDYVYSDTDSIKLVNVESHAAYFEEYNRRITNQLLHALKQRNIEADMICPKTVKGVEKPLGVWDYEGLYSRFKTLGAKRYLTFGKNGLELTLAGVRKASGADFLFITCMDIDKIFDAFSDGLIFPEAATGKQTHIYIDEPRDGVVTDYQGIAAEYHELSGIHLEGAEYRLSINPQYMSFILERIKGLEYGKIL